MLGHHEKGKVLDAIDSTRKSLEEARLKEESASKRVAEAQHELERFQRSLELVVATSIREGYEKALKSLGSHLAPISILPTELLSCIFSTGLEMELQALQSALAPVMALRKEEMELRGPTPSALNFAETCSHVNSHWRRVALTTPVLWRELRFSKRPAKNERERVWLERSKRTNLFIYFPYMHKPLFNELLETLRLHLPRARIISMEGQRIKHLQNFLRNLPPRMDNLRILELRADYHQLEGDYVQNLFEEGAPHLQEVTLEYISLHLVVFPTNNITKLCLVHSDIRVLQLDAVLQSVASTLQWLSIELSHVDPPQSNLTIPPQLSSSPTPFPNLHTLELGEDGLLISTHILTNFWFPVLRTLHLDLQNDQIETFTGFLGTPAPATIDATKAQKVPFFNVRELVIRNMEGLSPAGFEVLLMNGFPSLEMLDAADDFDENELAAIFSGANRGCKGLSSLRLLCCVGDMLKRFVEERFDKRSGVTPLRRLELETRDGIFQEDWQYLRAKVDEVHLVDPVSREELFTDDDGDLDTVDPQHAADADADGEDDWTIEEMP